MSPSQISSHIPLVEAEIQRLGLVTDERHESLLVPRYPTDHETGEVNPDAMEEYLRLIARVRDMSPSEKVTRILEIKIGAGIFASMTEKECSYRVPFWTQALVTNPRVELRIDDPGQVWYPHDPNVVIPFSGMDTLDAILSQASDAMIWSLLVKNLPELVQLFDSKKESVLEALGRGNLATFWNHDMRMNLLLVAYLAHRCWGVRKEDINIVIGPAITTTQMGYAGMVRHGNAIKTWPDTKKANTGYPYKDQVIAAMWKEMINQFKAKTGKILIMSPGGTTDLFDETSGIYTLPKPSDSVAKLIAERILGTKSKLNMNVMVGGTNARTISPGNVGLHFRQPAYMSISEVTNNPEAWNDIPKHVVDRDGNPIAQWGNVDKI